MQVCSSHGFASKSQAHKLRRGSERKVHWTTGRHMSSAHRAIFPSAEVFDELAFPMTDGKPGVARARAMAPRGGRLRILRNVRVTPISRV